MRLEEGLWRPDVATFYEGAVSPHSIQDTTRWLPGHTRAGLLQPRTIAHALNQQWTRAIRGDNLAEGFLTTLYSVADHQVLCAAVEVAVLVTCAS
ncbi:hypothetical protein [Hymenobacter cheonanensis]|uniref:hypothetical protein n=1 Tax=Hymenobacter sp. CA2-7 TaxID=3063993 RepID=UPI002713C081|nr:hypothetical protein [Hymenobacter sp. CA2-7]MDO7886645.1 hypothetical protein [Hymenobacter sp. CA2-7]